MSERVTFEAWAGMLPNGKLWTFLATAKTRLLPSRKAMVGHAMFNGRREARPVRVRVTVQPIESAPTGDK